MCKVLTRSCEILARLKMPHKKLADDIAHREVALQIRPLLSFLLEGLGNLGSDLDDELVPWRSGCWCLSRHVQNPSKHVRAMQGVLATFFPLRLGLLADGQL